jgi:hypothetical protein
VFPAVIGLLEINCGGFVTNKLTTTENTSTSAFRRKPDAANSV